MLMEKEELREKLDMLRLKVQERVETEESIESETAALLAKSMLLDEELTSEMQEFVSMRGKMVTLRKKNKALHSNMINKLLKMGEKYPIYERGTNSGPGDTHPEATEEDDDEEIIYNRPFPGRLKG
ncbi:hypothetical protein EJD97_019151 [Solanum chilense]|uniref:Uncharacterized protein n=1 Tax=Solanum chilense TaxID=4083 RepID=A0A6N2C9I0_SOLCI|nr:hypothetical protein EJD97_019151 [Solanum chilense]